MRASSMTRVVSEYAAGLLYRAELRESARRERVQTLRDRLPLAVAALARLGATRVVLFGSLRTGESHDRSDVDLAVEGICASHYWRAVDVASRELGVTVDLVPLEEASPSLRARIQEEGEVLFG